MPSTRNDDASAKPKIAVALPVGDLRTRLLRLLERADVCVQTVAQDDVWETIKGHEADIVLVRRSQIPPGGTAMIDSLTERDDTPEIVVLTDEESPSDRTRLLAVGASHVLSEGAPSRELEETLEDLAVVAADGGIDGPEVEGNLAEPRLADFISRSPRMKEFLDTVRLVVETDSSLLITGETGVGKERLARAIHAEGRRSSGPFVAVNCGALPENLLDSELFGHEKGAFTGAERKRRGQFELAEGGTIFLDEIGDMPKALQVKLLTVLQRRELQRLGSETTLKVNVRVMAAANRDLGEDVERGQFRKDLYYRLNVVPLRIPPLRERRHDIADLVGRTIKFFRESLGKSQVVGMCSEALESLLRYDFPGNVRELINLLERAMLMCRGPIITLADLPEEMRGGPADSGVGRPEERGHSAWTGSVEQPVPEEWLQRPLREVRQTLIAAFEEAYLKGLLTKTKGVVGETAELAGMTSRSLYEKMRRYGLRKEDFRG